MRTTGRRNNHRWQMPLLILVGSVLLSASAATAQQPFGDAKKESRDENNKMHIRSVLRVTKTTRQPFIEVEVYSDRAFPVLNAAVVLLVGERVFQGGGYGDTKGHVLIFALTPKEFAKTKTGDDVIVTYQGADLKKVHDEDSGQGKGRWVWKFGKLDKSKIR
ncbi:MAG: hypothetical protein ACR2H4_07590 [Pyrinomonadaceae bacterium]